MRFASVALLLLAAQDPKLEWRDEDVGDGVAWRRAAFGKQTIHLLEIDLGKKGVKAGFVRGLGQKKLGEIAGGTDAIAAIAGVDGGFLRSDGKKMSAGAGGACIGWTKEGKVAFTKVEADGDWPDVEHAVGGGVMLIEKGQVAAGLDGDAKDARAAAGITARDRLYYVVADGGMTLSALARVMKELSCMTAISLGSGASASMWVRGKPGEGIVGGSEAAVANALVVFAKDVIVFDDRDAQFSCQPKAKWMRDGRSTTGTTGKSTVTKGADSRAVGNDFMFADASLGAEAMWKLEVEFKGEYDVYARWPEGAYTPHAVFQIVAGVEQKEIKIDQSKNGGTWVKLGTVTLMKGGPAQRVVLTGEDDKPLAADAVKIVQR